MSEIIQIKYGYQLHIRLENLLDEPEETEAKMEFGSEEEGLFFKQDRIEEEQLSDDWLKFWTGRIEKENQQIFTYTFDEARIKYERNQHNLPEEHILIVPESGVMLQFYKGEKHKEAKLAEHSLHHDPASSGWEIEYKIEAFESEKKTILGYECYKMHIEQTKRHKKENWLDRNRYELFVTDKINLPARLVIPLWEPVMDLCALEIKDIDMRKPNSYAIKYAIEIREDIEESEIELSKEYSDLLTYRNKQ